MTPRQHTPIKLWFVAAVRGVALVRGVAVLRCVAAKNHNTRKRVKTLTHQGLEVFLAMIVAAVALKRGVIHYIFFCCDEKKNYPKTAILTATTATNRYSPLIPRV